MAYEFKLPDLGEGLSEGEIVSWKVNEGDSVAADQPLVSVLTDKAEVEIPSPKAGTILKLMAKPGQKIQVGKVFVVIGEKGESYAAGGGQPKAQAPSASQGATASPGAKPAATAPAGGGGMAGTGGASATPAVRKMAKDMGVNLESLTGTGPGGRVTEDDVRKAQSGGGNGASAPAAPAMKPLTVAGPEERVPFAGIRRKTAEKMVQSKRAIPHVTHVDEVDVTDLIALREELKPEAAKRGVKLTYLAFIVKAVVKGLKEFPYFNAALDEAAGAISLRKYYNIGIAVDTPHGLFSPVVKDADKKSVWEVAADIIRIAEKAKTNKLELADLKDGTFTITNIGPLGGTAATPIVIHPECAILAVMKIREMPRVKDKQIVVRSVMNLCLSFDHRLVDGAEAARFINTILKSIENPRTLL